MLFDENDGMNPATDAPAEGGDMPAAPAPEGESTEGGDAAPESM